MKKKNLPAMKLVTVTKHFTISTRIVSVVQTVKLHNPLQMRKSTITWDRTGDQRP